jgi:hypothetical protein
MPILILTSQKRYRKPFFGYFLDASQRIGGYLKIIGKRYGGRLKMAGKLTICHSLRLVERESVGDTVREFLLIVGHHDECLIASVQKVSMIFFTNWRFRLSRPCNGSSKMRSSGSLTKALASKTSRCSPLESLRNVPVFHAVKAEDMHPEAALLEFFLVGFHGIIPRKSFSPLATIRMQGCRADRLCASPATRNRCGL